MAGLLYREDFDDVRDRLTRWWNGGDIARAVAQIVAPRPKPLEDIPAMPEPPGWCTAYSTSSFEYRLNLNRRGCIGNCYLGDAVPTVNADLGANCLALFLGCKGVEGTGTVWFEPFIDDPDKADLRYDPDNFYWRFCVDLTKENLRHAEGKCLHTFPDFIEGLDTLAAMRGTQPLLHDLIDRPDWVHRCLARITDLYFRYYDRIYDLIRDDRGGSVFWAWAPGRLAKFQCDFSAMISPAMFREFMLPVLAEMTERVSYCMYHWDGPGAICHHDALLSLPALDMLQWTPGDGHEPCGDKRWWPLYHKTFDAGKKVHIGVHKDEIPPLLREFGPKSKGFLLGVWGVESKQEGEELIKRLQV
jgi:5-methyltetrahydrofolate--homocysteine methyltransferase